MDFPNLNLGQKEIHQGVQNEKRLTTRCNIIQGFSNAPGFSGLVVFCDPQKFQQECKHCLISDKYLYSAYKL